MFRVLPKRKKGKTRASSDSDSEHEKEVVHNHRKDKDIEDEQEDNRHDETEPLSAIILDKTQPTEALHRRGPGQFLDRVETIPPPDRSTVKHFYPVETNHLTPDTQDKIVKWQEENQKLKAALKEDPMYQFAYLVAGNLDHVSVDSLIEEQPQWPAPTAFEEAQKKAVRAMNSLTASGFLDFTPVFGTQVQNAYDDMQSWFEEQNPSGGDPARHAQRAYRGAPMFVGKLGRLAVDVAKNPKLPRLEDFINKPGTLRNYFAQLVALNIKRNRNLANKQYHIVVDYDRIMLERTMLLKRIMKVLANPSLKKMSL